LAESSEPLKKKGKTDREEAARTASLSRGAGFYSRTKKKKITERPFGIHRGGRDRRRSGCLATKRARAFYRTCNRGGKRNEIIYYGLRREKNFAET